jgi:predicted MFS family arabinose efflux permease
MSTYLRALRHRDFRYLFLGQSASAVGDQVVIVALALYITQRTGSVGDLGLVLAAQSVPLVALLLFGGVWADRLPRHRIMIVSDLARAMLHAILAGLILTGGASVGAMVVIEALFGAARAFFQPAYTGLMPQTISEEHKQDAWALSAMTANLAFLVGPALGAALVLGLGAGAAFALDAATFVLSAALLARVRPRARTPATAAVARQSVATELRVGFKEVVARPWVAVTIAAFAGAVFACYAQYYALAPSIARDFYGGAGLFGVLESVAGGGAVLGSLVGVRWRPRRPLLTGLLLTLVWPVAAFSFAVGTSLVAVVPLTFAAGFGFSLFGIWWETSLARHIPPSALSRVSAYDWMGSLALLPLGFAMAGPLATALGERTVVGAGAVVAFVLLAVAITPRSTRHLGGADDAWARSPQQRAGDVGEELGREPEVADVDSFVGVVH